MYRGETTRSWVTRFNTERLIIDKPDEETSINAFRKGIFVDLDLYKELTKHPCDTYAGVMRKAEDQMRWEEDYAARYSYYEPDEEGKDNGSGSRKSSKKKNKKNWRAEPYPTANRSEPNDTHQVEKPKKDLPPTFAQRGFNVSATQLIKGLYKLGDAVRWPHKMLTSPDQRDKTKYCDFHEDYGHRTEDCISLRIQIAELLKRGYLTDLLKKPDKKHPDNPQPGPPKQPQTSQSGVKTINFIAGGSDISGVTYSAAKRHTRELPMEPQELHLAEGEAIPGPITFSDEEIVPGTHDDALVITLKIADYQVKRILIDPESSVNILYRGTVKEMNLEDEMSYYPTTLVFGNGAADQSKAIINLTTTVAGMNVKFTYHVMNCPSSYNAILGRPFIHKMKAVPSTLHQCIKFNTPWGVKTIHGQQRASRECYQAALKATTQQPA